MGRAVDTIGLFNTQAAAGAFPQALAAMPGDSLVIRSVVGDSLAHIKAYLYQSNAAAQKTRIISPLLHDNVTGFTWVPGENPGLFLVPAESQIDLNENDTLVVQGSCGAATTITAGLVVEYDNIRGAEADLHRWHDIKDDIKWYKSVEIDLNAIAVGAWTDTSLTTTENQLHADKQYAVIGYDVSTPLAAVGIKGICTSNLRFCGPGSAQTIDITDYYVRMSEYHQDPYIPVFQANDRAAVFVSAINGTAVAGGGAIVSLIVAELKTRR